MTTLNPSLPNSSLPLVPTPSLYSPRWWPLGSSTWGLLLLLLYFLFFSLFRRSELNIRSIFAIFGSLILLSSFSWRFLFYLLFSFPVFFFFRFFSSALRFCSFFTCFVFFSLLIYTWFFFFNFFLSIAYRFLFLIRTFLLSSLFTLDLNFLLVFLLIYGIIPFPI